VILLENSPIEGIEEDIEAMEMQEQFFTGKPVNAIHYIGHQQDNQ